MKKIQHIVTAVFLFLLTLTEAQAFDIQDIISPLPGTYANLQPLVLHAEEGEELYYSLSSSDPMESGFSYDGPVVINQLGEVFLKIACVTSEGREDFTVRYSVEPAAFSTTDSAAAAFVQDISAASIIDYYSGSEFQVPDGFSLYLNGSRNRCPLKTLVLPETNNLERYISVRVTEGTFVWQFVMRLLPKERYSSFEKQELPFELKDWTTFTFTDRNYIWQIDDEYWSGDEESRELDRSVPHTVRWQEVAYQRGNPVYEFLLPPAPQFKASESGDGSVTYRTTVSGYSFAQDGSPLSDHLTAYAFEGEELNESFTVSVWYKGVFQGKSSLAFFIDRNPPEAPVITSSASSAFARSEVKVSVEAEKNAVLYCRVSSPVVSDTGFSSGTAPLTQDLTFTDFNPEGLTLKSVDQKATFYRIIAWAVDGQDNKSPETVFDVTVDQFNYYLDAGSLSDVHDGSYSHPFNDIVQALNFLSDVPESCLHVTGNFVVSQPLVIKSSVSMDSLFSQITFTEGAGIIIDGGTLKARNIFFARELYDEGSRPLITCTGGSLFLDGCELSGSYVKGGILAKCSSSELSVVNTGFTVQSSSYALCLSASDCNASVKASRFTSVSSGAVGLSFDGGFLDIRESSVYVLGTLGRCIELLSSRASIKDNVLSLEMNSEAKGSSWLFADKSSVVTENSGNTVTGK